MSEDLECVEIPEEFFDIKNHTIHLPYKKYEDLKALKKRHIVCWFFTGAFAASLFWIAICFVVMELI